MEWANLKRPCVASHRVQVLPHAILWRSCRKPALSPKASAAHQPLPPRKAGLRGQSAFPNVTCEMRDCP